MSPDQRAQRDRVRARRVAEAAAHAARKAERAPRRDDAGRSGANEEE